MQVSADTCGTSTLVTYYSNYIVKYSLGIGPIGAEAAKYAYIQYLSLGLCAKVPVVAADSIGILA